MQICLALKGAPGILKYQLLSMLRQRIWPSVQRRPSSRLALLTGQGMLLMLSIPVWHHGLGRVSACSALVDAEDMNGEPTYCASQVQPAWGGCEMRVCWDGVRACAQAHIVLLRGRSSPGADHAGVVVAALAKPAPVVAHQVHVQVVGGRRGFPALQLLHSPGAKEQRCSTWVQQDSKG